MNFGRHGTLSKKWLISKGINILDDRENAAIFSPKYETSYR